MKMISFKTFLNESTDMRLSPEDAAHIVAKSCKPFFKMTGFKYDGKQLTGALYRGTSEVPGFASIWTGSRERDPRDSSMKLHRMLDAYLNDKFGFPYRSKGVFCSNSKIIAAGYGKRCLIFPVGKFKYVYSTIVDDAYTAFQNEKYDTPELRYQIMQDMRSELEQMFEAQDGFKRFELFKAQFNKDEDAEKWYDLVDKWLRKTNPYTNKNLEGLLTSSGFGSTAEIMIQCNSYYLIDAYNSDAAGKLTDDGKLFLNTLMEQLK